MKWAYLILEIVISHLAFLAAWLWVANSAVPFPGKEIIFILYLAALASLLWKPTTLKELLTVALSAGFLAGGLGMAGIYIFFPQAVHDLDTEASKVLLSLQAGGLTSGLYCLYGLVIFGLKNSFRGVYKK